MTAPESGAAGASGGAAGAGGDTGGTGGSAAAGTGGSATGAGGSADGTGGGVAGSGGSAGDGGSAGGVGGRGGSAGGTGGAVAGTAGMGGRGGSGGRGGFGGTGGRGGSGGNGAGGEPGGLIACWRFNEGTGTTSSDCSGNGQTLTASATGANFVVGHNQSGGMAFDGIAGYAYLVPLDGQPLLTLPVSSLTMSAWVKPDDAASGRPFATAVARTHEDNLFQDFWLGLAGGKPACTIHNPNMQGAIALGVAPANVWTHIACTYAPSGVVTLYVNGTAAASFTSNEILGPIPTRILVGAAETDALQAFLPGVVDDVRIYKDALTPSEVASIAQ